MNAVLQVIKFSFKRDHTILEDKNGKTYFSKNIFDSLYFSFYFILFFCELFFLKAEESFNSILNTEMHLYN
jgi:hypothetical protein